MNPNGRGVALVLSGFFAGALTASIVPWAPLPKAILVGAVAALVALAVGLALGRGASPSPEGAGAKPSQ